MRPRTQTLVIGVLIILLVCGHMIKPVTNYLMLPIGRILAFGGSAYVALAVNPVIGLLIALVCLQAMSEFYIVEHFVGIVKAEGAGQGTVMDEVARNIGMGKNEADLKSMLAILPRKTRVHMKTNVIPKWTARVEESRKKAGKLAMENKENLSEMRLIGTGNPLCQCPPGYTYTASTNDCKNNKGKVAKPSMCRCSSGYAYDTVTGVCKQSSTMSSPIPVTAPAPEGTDTPALESAPSAPTASSLRPMQIELSDADKREILGKPPLPVA